MKQATATVNLEGYRFVSFKSKTEDRRKYTRKRHLLNISIKEVYPPEGHLLFTSFQNKGTDCSDSDTGSEIEEQPTNIDENIRNCFLIGGARKAEESTWQFSNELYTIIFNHSRSDFWLEDTICHTANKFSGASLPGLTYSSGFVFEQQESDDIAFIIWGGNNLSRFEPVNELYCLSQQTVRKKIKYNTTIFLPSSDGFEDPRFRNIKLQNGDIPAARFGHSLTKVSVCKAIMFGGLCMPKRNTIAANCSDIFEQSNAPGQLFVLELNPAADFDATTVNVRPTWKKVNTINETLERSFHTATFIESLQSIVVLGGVSYKDGVASACFSLEEIVILKIEDLSGNFISLKTEKIPSLKDIYLSGHASTASPTEDTHIYLFGGYEQNSSAYDKNIRPSSNLFVIDVVRKQAIKKIAPNSMATACHSLTFVSQAVLIILGGTNQSIQLFTSKELVPDKCDLGTRCTIDDTFISPIPWIQCDGICKRWLHQFCINLKIVPKNEFICDQCKSSVKRGHKRKSRK